jgi:hypothetical protein
MSKYLSKYVSDGKKTPKKKAPIFNTGYHKKQHEPQNPSKFKKPQKPKTITNHDKKFINTDDSMHVEYQLGRGKETTETSVPKFEKIISAFLDYSTILFGPSGAGKSFLIYDFMHLLQNMFPTVYIFAPTNPEKHDFDDMIPGALIFEDVKLDKITDIYNKQKAAAEIYGNANSLKVLKKLFSIKYLDFNPRCLIIFDDATSEVDAIVKKGRKEENPIIEHFFYKGRWAHITHMYSCHDDKKFDSELRKNAFNIIFASKQVASAFFGRSSNNFTLEEKKKAQAIINEIFDEEKYGKHRKLIWTRLATEQFTWILGEDHDSFTMCSKLVWKLCNKVKKHEGNFDTSNKWMGKFAEYT